MVHRFLFLILAGLKIESICSVIIQERDPLSQDWWPDYQNENQGDYTQSDLFTSTGNNQQESEYAAPIASDFFDSPDPSLSILDSDNILDAGDPDSLTLGCSSEDSSPMTGLSKGKKSKKICPATTLDLPSAATFDKKSDCKPESEICPIGKSAMCCDGETQGWLAYSGFSVGGCIKYSEGDNCDLPICKAIGTGLFNSIPFKTLFCCDFLGMAFMDPDAAFGCTYSFL